MKVFLFALSFVAFWLLSSYSEAAEPRPVWYLVSSLELEKLETLSANSEASRQRAELSLKQSQETARSLKASSTLLTAHLQKERETTRRLERSFNQFVVDQSNTLTAITARATKAEIALEKKKAAAFKILMIAIIEGAAIAGYLAFKFRAILRKMIPV